MINKRLRSYVLYNEDGRVIPSSLIRRTKKPRISGRIVKEVSELLALPRSNGSKRRAFIRMDKTGRIFSGPIVREQYPSKDRRFREIPFDICCFEADEPIVIDQDLPEVLNLGIGDDLDDLEVTLSSGTNVTTQWQNSPNGTDWTDVPDGELAVDTSVEGTTYVRVILSNSVSEVTSDITEVNVAAIE